MDAVGTQQSLSIGDVASLPEAVRDFCGRQAEQCARLGIDVTQFGLSHVAFRTRTFRDYLVWREALEGVATGNLENVWNGRPISKIKLAEPIAVAPGGAVSLVELIPPFHQRVYAMGLEHVGYVLGDAVDDFAARHRDVLTGQQFQGSFCAPYYRLFGDYTHVKFYRWSLGEVCRREGGRLDVVTHADWEPADPDAGPYQLT